MSRYRYGQPNPEVEADTRQDETAYRHAFRRYVRGEPLSPDEQAELDYWRGSGSDSYPVPSDLDPTMWPDWLRRSVTTRRRLS